MSTATAREKWLSKRRTMITASDVPAALGVSRWKSPFTLYHEKRGTAAPVEETLAMELGSLMEPIIAKVYRNQTGRKLDRHPQHRLIVHPDYDWLGATPDYLIVDDGKHPLQIKTAGEFGADDWGDGDAPLPADVQLQAEIAVMGTTWGGLCGLIGNRRLHIMDRERNDRLIAAMLPKLREFWERVQSGDPPRVDGSESTARTLAFLHPKDNGEIVYLPDECGALMEQLEQAKADITAAELRKDEAANALRHAIADATWGVLGDGRCYSYKWQSRRGYLKVPADHAEALLAAGIRFEEMNGAEFRKLIRAKAPKQTGGITT